jgi:hypothetical protein
VSQDDLSTRENQRPPSRRRWIVSLNIAAAGAVAAIVAVVAIGGHRPPSNASPTPSLTSAAAQPASSPPDATTSPTLGDSATAAPPPSFTGYGASEYSCNEEGSIYSQAGGSEVPFSFVNETSGELQIIWFDSIGNATPEDTLPAGQTYTVNTFTDYAWMVASPSGGCLGIFVITGSGHVTAS